MGPCGAEKYFSARNRAPRASAVLCFISSKFICLKCTAPCPLYLGKTAIDQHFLEPLINRLDIWQGKRISSFADLDGEAWP